MFEHDKVFSPSKGEYERSIAQAGEVLLALAHGKSLRDLSHFETVRVSGEIQARQLDGMVGAAIATEMGKVDRSRTGVEIVSLPLSHAGAAGKATIFRDLIVATPSAGGYLVGTDSLDPASGLNAVAIHQDLGVTEVLGRGANVGLPFWSADPNGAWMPDETTPITEDSPTVGLVPSTPCTYGVVIDVSHKELSMRPQVAGAVLRLEADRIQRAISAGLISGSGTGGEPKGIVNVSNIGTGTGTSIDYAKMQDAVIKQLTTANVPLENIKAIANPDASHILRTRERATGAGRFLVEYNRALDGVPFFTTAHIAAGKMLSGNFAECLLVFFGSFNVLVDPYSQSGAGVVRFVAFVSIDVQVVNPLAFCLTSSIT